MEVRDMILNDAPDRQKYVQWLELTNGTPETAAFVLERWGEIFDMPPGATFEVIGESILDGHTPKGHFAVELRPGLIVASAWPGAAVAVYHQGLELGDAVARGRFPAAAREGER
jgi:hypothetical protein